VAVAAEVDVGLTVTWLGQNRVALHYGTFVSLCSVTMLLLPLKKSDEQSKSYHVVLKTVRSLKKI
jgi:hypothetical protein